MPLCKDIANAKEFSIVFEHLDLAETRPAPLLREVLLRLPDRADALEGRGLGPQEPVPEGGGPVGRASDATGLLFEACG